MSNWKMAAVRQHLQFVNEQKLQGKMLSEKEIVSYLVLCIYNLAGSLNNFIKRHWSGNVINMNDVKDDIADLTINMHVLSIYYNIDVEEVCNKRLEGN